ncbi:hypothetical protein B0T25DRAFT_536913 [Lasiosphaeria hispida]|uniref:Uncharacterized protein n=1 Tax=Lasiosphaeria hispida TaxID=260671 RepID=A0AAJ0HKF0_9PEZI|nr:hypothetical protein B0T25DRAFT_536913 [Lasiosphaeria hispida]
MKYITCAIIILLPGLALSVSPVFVLPGLAPSSWFENLAVRPNGLILATRGDAPEIWQINPATGQGAKLMTVIGAFNLTGIAEITSGHHSQEQKREETYVFGSSYIPAPLQVEPGSAKVWTLRFGNGITPTVSLLAELPKAGFINGVAAWGSRRVLLGDTIEEAVYLMDVDTGFFTTPLTNMTGINGVQTAPGYIYWANHALQRLSRIPVDNDAFHTGPAEILATDQAIDDFALAIDKTGRGRAFIGAMYDNAVVQVVFGPPPNSGTGVKSIVAGNLSGTGVGLCAVVVLGRRAEDIGVLYASVNMGGGNAAIVAISTR